MAALHANLEGLCNSARSDRAILAKDLLAEVCPRGLRDNTSLPWIDPHKDIGRLLALLDAVEFTEHRVRLPLDVYVERLEELYAPSGSGCPPK